MLWGLLPRSPDPKTNAKVEIQQAEPSPGLACFRFSSSRPTALSIALFVNEDDGQVFDSQRLARPTTRPCLVRVEDRSRRGVGHISERQREHGNRHSGEFRRSQSQRSGHSGADLRRLTRSTQTQVLRRIIRDERTVVYPRLQRDFHRLLGGPQVRQVHVTAAGCPRRISRPLISRSTAAWGATRPSKRSSISGFSGTRHSIHNAPESPAGHGPRVDSAVRLARGRWAARSPGSGSGRQQVNIPAGTSGPRNATQCGNPNQQPNNLGRTGRTWHTWRTPRQGLSSI